MTAALPTFTLKGSVFDLPSVDNPTALSAMVLTPNTRGQVVSIGSDLHRPEPITVDFDDDGAMNGGAGVELLAALDSLEEPLQWSVQVIADRGFPRAPMPFWFQAPPAGETIWLGDISPSPLLSPTGITRGPRGVDDVKAVGNAIQFEFHGEPVGDPIPLAISGIDCGEFGTNRDGSYIDGGTL